MGDASVNMTMDRLKNMGKSTGIGSAFDTVPIPEEGLFTPDEMEALSGTWSSNSPKLNWSVGNTEKKQDTPEDKERHDANFRRIITVIIAVLTFLVFLEIIFCKFVIPSMTSPYVTVTGQQNYTPTQIVDMLRPMNITNWFKFDVERAVSIIASASGIDSATVKKIFPNKIYITVTERTPVALTFINIDNKTVALQIDKNGVLFNGDKNFQMNNSVPILSGLPINYLNEGMRIPERYRLLIEQIAAIQKLPQKYFAAISEICVVPKEYGNYELIIIPTKSKIRIITDRNLTEDSLKYMMVALDVVTSIDKDATQINLRNGVVSYIK